MRVRLEMTIGDISHAAEVEGEPLGRTEDVLRGMFRAAREALDGPEGVVEGPPPPPPGENVNTNR